jgi:CheY-like chemotaxis protein
MQPSGSIQPQSLPRALPDASPGYLLCIDDNPVNGLLLQEFFRLRRGLRVRVACSGTEGLAMAMAERPLAVLLDLMLPDMSGLVVLDQLRGQVATASLPVAIVSGCVDPDDLALARRHGAQAHWPKPLDLSRLDDLLQALLDGAG